MRLKGQHESDNGEICEEWTHLKISGGVCGGGASMKAAVAAITATSTPARAYTRLSSVARFSGSALRRPQKKRVLG
jgi:hypothetical protein